MMPSWCRQVNWGNCEIPWVECTVLCVKNDWKGQFWGTIVCQNYTVYSVFPSGMTSHSKITQFNWECIGPLRHSYILEVNINISSKWAIFGLCHNCIQWVIYVYTIFRWFNSDDVYAMYVNSSINTLLIIEVHKYVYSSVRGEINEHTLSIQW